MHNLLSPGELAAWRAFLVAASRTLEQIDQTLQKRTGMTLTDYEILLALAGTEDRRLRMSELADGVYVSRSRLTYRVDRLTEVGFVTREECEDDRRGLWAILTDKGDAALAEATPGHHHTIRQRLFAALEAQEIEHLQSVLRAMIDSADSDR